MEILTHAQRLEALAFFNRMTVEEYLNNIGREEIDMGALNMDVTRQRVSEREEEQLDELRTMFVKQNRV